MRTLSKALLWFLILLLIALLAFLVPPHLQVRSVSANPPGYEVLQSLKSERGPTALYYINTSEQSLERGVLTHSVFVFEWSDGKLLLIDAGMRRAQAEDFAELLSSISGGGELVVHGNIAQLLGERVEDVAGVAFTHLHIDHTEGVVALCDAKQGNATPGNPALLQTPFQLNEQNYNTTEGAALLQNSCLRAAPMREGALWVSEAFPGVGMIAAGGHTPGSTLFAAWIQGQLYVLSGDITNTKADILADRGKGWVYSNLMVPEDTVQTAALRQWLKTLDDRDDTTVVVSHDLGDINASGLPAFSAN